MDRQERRQVPDQGIAGAPEERPGVPRERPPSPAPGAHWATPERQQRGLRELERSGIKSPTPVFGTAQPPRLVSGRVRRVAYGIPDHRTMHWALLLAADRLDVLEHRLGRALVLLPAVGAGLIGYLVVTRALQRRAHGSRGT